METFLVVLAPIVIGWLLNEEAKRRDIREKKKRKRYELLILALNAYHQNGQASGKRVQFIHQVNLSWLYCSDKFIRKAYEFINSSEDFSQASEEQKDKLLGELMVIIRKDFKGCTDLKSSEFKNYSTRIG